MVNKTIGNLIVYFFRGGFHIRINTRVSELLRLKLNGKEIQENGFVFSFCLYTHVLSSFVSLS